GPIRTAATASRCTTARTVSRSTPRPGSGSEVRPFWLGGSGAFNDATVVQVNRDISGLDFALSGP
ncbi:MAG TPA: hypothetical protein VFA01_02050, partial [Candidatus Dormibacteraeota bacterium]|nr:hypothetical protein [Candidatus Dormibacteraeota bacterium]